MKNKSLLFIGGYIPPKLQDLYIKRNRKNFPYAANSFQEKLIKGLSNYFNLTVLSKPFIGSFPNNSSILINKETKFTLTKTTNNIILSFLNLPIFKQFIIPFRFVKYIRNFININIRKKRYYFIYSFGIETYTYLKTIKKFDKNAKIIISLHDLPEYTMMAVSNKYKRKFIIYILYYLMKKSEKFIYGLITISRFMLNHFNNKDIFKGLKRNLVIEALADEKYISKLRKNTLTKSILYSGGLISNYGVLELIDAFRLIEDKAIKLLIAGDGPLKSKIIKFTSLDPRIHYLGVLNNSDILKVQNESTILVNPRKPSAGIFTRYSFPIKTIEYLSTGKPVIAFKLEGIPEEYNDYLISPKDESINELKATLIKALNFDQNELDQIHFRNTKFILNKKSSKVQCKKIEEIFEVYE